MDIIGSDVDEHLDADAESAVGEQHDMPDLHTPVRRLDDVTANVDGVVGAVIEDAVVRHPIARKNIKYCEASSTTGTSSSSSSDASSVDPNVRLWCVVCQQLGREIVYFRNGNMLCAHMLDRHAAYFGKRDLR